MKHPLRKVVIPAAGLGTRFLPATKAVPKEMLPIVDMPTIQLIVGDDLFDSAEPGIGQLARVAMQTGKAAVALMPVPDDQTHMYGVAAGQRQSDGTILVDRLVEKPPRGSAPSNLAVIGRYLLP